MDLSELENWHYLLMAGGALLLLGLVIHWLPVKRLKVPGTVTATVGALAAGFAFGVMYLASFGYRPYEPEKTAVAEAAPPPRPTPPPGKGGTIPTSRGKSGNAPPSLARIQLSQLVATLDNVVDQPLTVSLSPADRAALSAELAGLQDQGEIRDEEASRKVRAIQRVLEKHRKTMEAAGYRWYGGKGGFAFPKDSPNPFKEGNGADRLKSLQTRLEPKAR